MNKNDLEMAAIEEIIVAACQRDWERFKSASDEPFGSEESMKENFTGAANILEKMDLKWDIDVETNKDSAGFSITRAKVTAKSGDRNPVIVVVRRNLKNNRIGIVSFYEDYDLSNEW